MAIASPHDAMRALARGTYRRDVAPGFAVKRPRCSKCRRVLLAGEGPNLSINGRRVCPTCFDRITGGDK
jgi:hypothetical protein